MKGSVILVGGFPEPVGGVTTFVRRLAASEKRIEEVVDVYFGREKEIPATYTGKYRALNGKGRGFFYLLFKMLAQRDKCVHFNFSGVRSLAFFLLLPKRNNKWILMLHHGVLERSLPDAVIAYALGRFDRIVCMNEAQYEGYRRYGVGAEKLVRASSYVRPAEAKGDETFQREIDSYFSARPTLVASGYPTAAYNFDWCTRFVGSREEYQLALFVYGDGPKRREIEQEQRKLKNVRVYWDQKEGNFNYALSRARCYLRPNTKDSFGIAVADAVNYGVAVLASDVCTRYQGARTFEPTTYESFEGTLTDLLTNGARDIGCASTPIIPFSYDLIP